MILLIDNYDSFTYNLYQYMGIFTEEIQVVRNDKITLEEIRSLHPERIVLSPGPKSPKEAGICMDVVREFLEQRPILGICLGHQCIGEALGGTVSYAKELCHGKQSLIWHTGESIFVDWISYPGGQVPFAGRTGRWAARLPAGAGQDGGRGDYGNAPQRVSGGGPAVPPRVYLYGVWETDDR